MPRISLVDPEKAIDYNVPLVAESANKLTANYNQNLATMDMIDQAAKNVTVHEQDAGAKLAAINRLKQQRDAITASKFSFTQAGEDVTSAVNQFNTDIRLKSAVQNNQAIRTTLAEIDKKYANNPALATYYKNKVNSYAGVDAFKIDDYTYKPWQAPEMVNPYDVYGHAEKYINDYMANLYTKGWKPVYLQGTKVPIYYENASHEQVAFDEVLRGAYNSLQGTPEAKAYLDVLGTASGKPVFDPSKVSQYRTSFNAKGKVQPTAADFQAGNFNPAAPDLIGGMLVAAADKASFDRFNVQRQQASEFDLYARGAGQPTQPDYLSSTTRPGTPSANNLPDLSNEDFEILNLEEKSIGDRMTLLSGTDKRYKSTADIEKLKAKDAETTKTINTLISKLPFVNPSLVVENGQIVGRKNAEGKTSYGLYSAKDIGDYLYKANNKTIFVSDKMLPIDKQRLTEQAIANGYKVVNTPDIHGILRFPPSIRKDATERMSAYYKGKKPDITPLQAEMTPEVTDYYGKKYQTLADLELSTMPAYVHKGINEGGGMYTEKADEAILNALGYSPKTTANVLDKVKVKVVGTSLGNASGKGAAGAGGLDLIVTGPNQKSVKITYAPNDQNSRLLQGLQGVFDVVHGRGLGKFYVDPETGEQLTEADINANRPYLEVLKTNYGKESASIQGQMRYADGVIRPIGKIQYDENGKAYIVPGAMTYKDFAEQRLKAVNPKLADNSQGTFNKTNPYLGI